MGAPSTAVVAAFCLVVAVDAWLAWQVLRGLRGVAEAMSSLRRRVDSMEMAVREFPLDRGHEKV